MNKIIKKIKASGGRPFIVGGAVRDRLMGIESKDIDIEVFGMSISELSNTLTEFHPSVVGKCFGVFKIGDMDISLPRKDNKTGIGHKDFDVSIDPNMTFEESAKRRDFTMNSMLMDPITNEIIDPFSGIQDIQNKIIKHTDSGKFVEDPLRALRAVQFACRFGFDIDDDTVSIIRQMNLDNLPKERIEAEIFKFLVKGKSFRQHGFPALVKTNVVKLFPEIEAIMGSEQDKEFHPEGDVGTHTAIALDNASKFEFDNDEHKFIIMLSILCHDIGKPSTKIFEEGHIRNPGHDKVGEELSMTFLNRFTEEKNIVDTVPSLVRNHMIFLNMFNNKENTKDSTIRRTALKVKLNDLFLIVKADVSATLSIKSPTVLDFAKTIIERAKELEVDSQKPQRIVMGRHLIERFGMTPGPKMGKLLNQLFERQIEGEFDTLDQGLQIVESAINEL